jgi:hypothetical protein
MLVVIMSSANVFFATAFKSSLFIFVILLPQEIQFFREVSLSSFSNLTTCVRKVIFLVRGVVCIQSYQQVSTNKQQDKTKYHELLPLLLIVRTHKQLIFDEVK